MTFEEKSTVTTTLVLALVFAIYFFISLRWLSDNPELDRAFPGLMVGAAVTVSILAIVSHVVLALFNHRRADEYDERDRLIASRGDQVSAYVLALTVFAGIVLAMMGARYFWIANTLLFGWVLAELIAGVIKIVLYRQGG